MELEIIRACAAAAANPAIGINAKIETLTMDVTGDLKPADVTVYNYVDHPFVARKTLNKDEVDTGKISLPCMVIYLEAAPQIEPIVRTVYRDGDYPVAFSYLSVELDDAKRMRDALYFNRAVLRFLTQFNRDDNEAMRQRNGVNFWVNPQIQIQQYTPDDQWTAAILAAQTVVPYRARETQP